MNYRNKLMNLSLIALAVFSACSDEVENGTHPGKGDQRLSFAVSMGRHERMETDSRHPCGFRFRGEHVRAENH